MVSPLVVYEKDGRPRFEHCGRRVLGSNPFPSPNRAALIVLLWGRIQYILYSHHQQYSPSKTPPLSHSTGIVTHALFGSKTASPASTTSIVRQVPIRCVLLVQANPWQYPILPRLDQFLDPRSMSFRFDPVESAVKKTGILPL